MPEANAEGYLASSRRTRICYQKDETTLTSSFLRLRFSCLVSSREAPALRPVAHSIQKRFRARLCFIHKTRSTLVAQNKEGCLPAEAASAQAGEATGRGAGTPRPCEALSAGAPARP